MHPDTSRLLRIAFATEASLITTETYSLQGGKIESGEYLIPSSQSMQIPDFQDAADGIIRPLCDYVHQMFGSQGSPCFNEDGSWREPRR